MFAIAATPARQSVGETITTLSSRLSSATLLEDRRAAIQGLRSFAKEYPASVASGALRGLIGELATDDVDTIKITLETLLMLFNPNESSPEASEEIALWLADEFTQRQENITTLLDFLDTNDFYSRLYSLQLLSAILSSRTERTEECIFEAPLGISRLVAVLDDTREAIRNEALSLLTYLTPTSTELQKRVAFEDAFDRIFNIIQNEGSLVNGDRTVEDCLILLANLLRLNISNQSYFRETGSVPKVARLLSDANTEQDIEGVTAQWAKDQQNRNIFALLAVLRLFLVVGGVGTQANQASFWQHGILEQVLFLAFSRSTEMQIKAEALTTCADLIRGNPSLQEGFAQLQVTSVLDEPPAEVNGVIQQSGIPHVYVIDGLLDLTLSVPLLAAFDSRLAACECIKAYFYSHPAIRKHFLRRAIEGHTSGADETANVLTTLLQPLDSQASSDPYRYWFAAVILFHLMFDDTNLKTLAMGVAEGDASEGEEVVTCIQALTGNLIISIQRNYDERIHVSYLILLCGWLFEDPDGVNDFLGEGSNLQTLVQAVLNPVGPGIVVQGLCCMLLGIIYEFSTKDSPVPRSTIHPIIMSQLGREKYIDKLTRLRSHPLLRDFEVLSQKLNSAVNGGLPEVYFDKTFVDFVKDNFSRLLRAIDREPGLEIPVIVNGVQKGISRDLVDSLRSQLEEKAKSLQKVEEELVSLGRQLGQEQADHRRARETSVIELGRIKHINEGLQRNHEEELSKLQTEHNRAVEEQKRQFERIQRTTEENFRLVESRLTSQAASLNEEINRLNVELAKANQNHVQEIQAAHGEIRKLNTELANASQNHVQDLQIANKEYTTSKRELSGQVQRAEEKAGDFESRYKAAVEKASKADAAIAEKEKEKQAVQGELDDLLMVFGDLEDKVNKYKERLIALGESVSDGEEDEEEGDGEDEEEDDVD